MHKKITVILLYDTRVDTHITGLQSWLNNLLANPDIVKLTQNFEPAKLEGYHGALMLWPLGHYVKGAERIAALQRFEQNNTLLEI